MSISNQDLFKIDQINSYTQNKTFLKPEALEKLNQELGSKESGFALKRDDHYDDLYDDIQGFIVSANGRYFRYDIDGFESIQYLVYDSESQLQSLYLDSRPVKNTDDYRKISFVIQLNEDYTGGEFEMFRSHDRYSAVSKQAGSLVMYSSFTPYRLTPVTQGKRKVLHGWVYGPPFR